MRVENKNPPKKGNIKIKGQPVLLYSVDGEDLTWNNFVKYETLYNELEVLADFDYIMKA